MIGHMAHVSEDDAALRAAGTENSLFQEQALPDRLSWSVAMLLMIGAISLGLWLGIWELVRLVL